MNETETGPCVNRRTVAPLEEIAARRAEIGARPVRVPVTPQELARESGLALHEVEQLIGEPELERYRQALERRNMLENELRVLEWERQWEQAACEVRRARTVDELQLLGCTSRRLAEAEEEVRSSR